MTVRFRSAGKAALVSVVTLVLAAAPGVAWAQEEAPRTPVGCEPDLNGVWDFRTLTPFERPEELADQDTWTEEEAAAFEADRLAFFEIRDDQEPADIVGNYNQFWFDPGDSVSATNQTSLVVDPPDGRVPPLNAVAAAKQAEMEQAREGVNRHVPTYGGFVEDLGPGMFAVRCILGFNTGPPMTPGGYNQNVQIVQTPDHVVLLNEMVHSSRVVPLDGRSHLPDGVRQWMGDSRGRWEGDTLVVETTNFLRETSFRGGVTTADPPPDRALHAGLRRDADVRSDGRGSEHLGPAVDLPVADAEERSAGLRVRLSRGKLRPLQHPRRRARRGGPGGRRGGGTPGVGCLGTEETNDQSTGCPGSSWRGLALPGAAMGQDGVPRTAGGKPDLSGTYDTATLTPLQRPQQFGTRGTLTAEEAALVESDPAALRTLFNIAPGGSDERREARNAASGTQEAEQVAPPAGGDGSGGAAGNVGGYNTFWIDRGTGVFQIDGEWRTSIITDPQNGRRPPLTDAAQARAAERARFFRANTGTAWWLEDDLKAPGPYDDPEIRPLAERCLLGFGSVAGPAHAARALQQPEEDRPDRRLRRHPR